MATLTDEWHLAAAKVSPLIWEIQKAHGWTVELARSRVRAIPALAKIKDYLGILTSEPELESVRDRLVVVPINHPKTKYKQPFLVERERPVVVYDWNGEIVFDGAISSEQHADFLKWCAGYFVRMKGLKPPVCGP